MRLLCACLLACAATLSAAEPSAPLLSFEPGFTYAFLSWEKAHQRADGGIRIVAKDTKGGGGLNRPLNASAFAEHSPELHVVVADGSKATRLRVALIDSDGTRHEFNLAIPGPGEHRLTPASGASLLEPDKIGKAGSEKGLDLAALIGVQVVGGWESKPIDITIKELAMHAPDDATLAARAASAAKRQAAAERQAKQEAEQQARITAMIAGGASHTPDDPSVERIYAVSPHILAVRIQERTITRNAMQAYQPQNGDERVVKDKKTTAVWANGELVMEPKGFQLKRKGKTIGVMSADGTRIRIDEAGTGNWLEPSTLGVPEAYALVTSDGTAITPSAVSVKRKPNSYRSRANSCVIYLHLEQALEEGASYTVQFKGINTSEPEVTYTHNSATVRSEAVHVSHIGFHPADPQKIGRISVWLGTGGHHDPGATGAPQCHLLDSDDQVVWSGAASLLRRHSEGDQTRDKRSLAKTDVYLVDFSDFATPGSYRLQVEGVGTSWPFPIDDNVWTNAFALSMQGLLSHRSGIALPKDLMGYERPRNMHPADGVKVVPVSRTMLHGESDAINQSFVDIIEGKASAEPALSDAWGGYMDAGDWDRRSLHLDVTGGLLEVYELNPEFWNRTALVLPAEERSNDLPDLLDEVWWNLSFYHRLQTPDGGVRGGIESSSHPRPCEASWQETLALGAFAPDPVSSLRFAAVAAQYARVSAPFDATRAATLQTDAIRAYDWALSDAGRAVIDSLPEKAGAKARKKWDISVANAAVQLLWLTADERFHAPVAAVVPLENEPIRAEGIAFTYARMPANLVDGERQAQTRAMVLQLGDDTLAFQQGNAWGVATAVPGLPLMGFVGYLSVPGMISKALPRAYALSGDKKYLAGLVTACGFSAGANPDNRAYTTGLGPDPVAWPLHIDSLVTGQLPPKGITVYGPSDPAANFAFESWVYQWYVTDKQATPTGKQWPMAEAYWDIYTIPANNEYTVHQTIGPTAYTWGFLAACDR
ncbi:MAG: glycoside hydrolase family 9 protein [Planctomycetota bacterium]|jgi:endoglucanase|nr:glycoside hydrolase family 9 protein [Planctomycetota bacterium]